MTTLINSNDISTTLLLILFTVIIPEVLSGWLGFLAGFAGFVLLLLKIYDLWLDIQEKRKKRK